MACVATERRHREGLKALGVFVTRDLHRHIARQAFESELTQAEWMRRVLAAAGPISSGEARE